jgi:hypothetical protein
MGKARIQTDYILALRPEPSRPDGPTVEQRMRMLLKVALRSYGFRCLSIGPDIPVDLPPPDPALDVTKTEPPFVAAKTAPKNDEIPEGPTDE